MRQRKGLVILGYFGAGNFGDDLMLRGALSELMANEDLPPITVVSYYDKPVPFLDAYDDRVRLIRLQGVFSKLFGLIPLFLRSRMAVFGGGTPFTDTEGDGSYKFFRLAHLLGCRFGYLSIGIGRLQSPLRLRRASWLFRNCEAAVFRDSDSLRRAQDLLGGAKDDRFILGEDLCYLDKFVTCATNERTSSDAEPGVLVLSWRYLPKAETGLKPQHLMDALLAALCELTRADRFSKIEILPLDSTADVDVHLLLCSKISERIANVEVVLLESPAIGEKLEIIRRADLYLSVRLHGAVVGKLLNVPTVGFNYSPKVDYFFRNIESKSLVEWDNLLNDPDCLKHAANRAFEEACRRIDIASRKSRAQRGLQKLVRTITQ